MQPKPEGKAEAKIKEVRDTLDKDHDNIPDALEGLIDKAKTLTVRPRRNLERQQPSWAKWPTRPRPNWKNQG